MKRNRVPSLCASIALWVAVAVVWSAGPLWAQTPPEVSFSPKRIQRISVAPVPSNEKQLTITLTAKEGTTRLPKFVAVRVNGKDLKLTDQAGNGRFTGTVTLDEPASLKGPLSVPVVEGETIPQATSAAGGGTGSGEKTSTCKVETVDCPNNCTSPVSHASCWLCLNIACTATVSTGKP